MNTTSVSTSQSGNSDSSAIATPQSDLHIEIGGANNVSWKDILRGLDGVAVATKTSISEVEKIVQAITKTATGELSISPQDQKVFSDKNIAFSIREWHTLVRAALSEENLWHRANIAVALAFMRRSGRQDIGIIPEDLSFVWSLLHEALLNTSISYTVSRSAQGFLAIPLWSLIKDGNIEELLRLHIWLPDGKRGIADLAIHAHQPFAQSWILAGQGRDYTYYSEPASDDTATHAEFGVAWSDSSSKENSKTYQTHQKSSTVVNTGKLIHVRPKTSEVHSRNMMYTVPAGVLHKSEVAPNVFHVTLFFFDSSRGFQQAAPVLGPVTRESYTQQRDPAGATAAELVKAVESFRTWETLHEQGLQHARHAEWEEAVRALRNALHISVTTTSLANAAHYHNVLLWKLGQMYRMLGRYSLASQTLEDTLRDMPVDQDRVEATGELAVVYRHLNRLEDAKHACEDQYSTAKGLGLERELCRAVGNLGMVNYQLFLRTRNMAFLDQAMNQLDERVERARKLKDATIMQNDKMTSNAQWAEASTREAIALARLSLCLTEKGDIEKAITVAFEALQVTHTQKDTTKIAFSRYFYGRALLLAGRHEEALAQFNPPRSCTPIIALCKEPSEEHCEYLREMIQAGADLELRDEQGYSALECAVYSGDVETQKVIEEGLRQQLSCEANKKFQRHCYEAILRKGYRELFQDKLRPVLLHANAGNNLEQLRLVYANALALEDEKRRIFDHLKCIKYTDFLRCGKIPRSSKDFTDDIISRADNGRIADYLLFLSYRWISEESGTRSAGDGPDDNENTQYHRMIRAIDEFLNIHPKVHREQLCLWIDYHCIDQEDQRSGVAALPLNLAQCNAMISLVDDQYYDRAWCCVEVIMMQALRKAYGIHLWFEHVIDPMNGREGFREGPLDLDINMADKKMTYESDRPKIMFLERQSKLLG